MPMNYLSLRVDAMASSSEKGDYNVHYQITIRGLCPLSCAQRFTRECSYLDLYTL